MFGEHMKRCVFIHSSVCVVLKTNQSGYELLNLENVLFLNSDNFDATDLRF